jgi:hypothetical protein
MPAPSPSPKEQASDSAQNNKKHPSGLPVVIVETPEQAIARESAEKKSRDHETKDLDAQVRAADAGERGATAAERQIVPTLAAALLSFLGTVLILWNLRLTMQANVIAQDAAKKQLRAYLSLDGILFRDSESCQINAKNFEPTQIISRVGGVYIQHSEEETEQ